MVKTDAELRRKVITSKDGRFKATVATAEDMDELAGVFAAGFVDNPDIPIIPKIYPQLHTPKGRKNLAERFRALIEADPTAYFVKVVDTTQHDRMVMQGKWVIRDDDPGFWKLVGPYWDSEEARQAAEAEGNIFIENRRKVMSATSGRRVYGISAVCTHPDFRGLGAGELWVQWGIEEADAEGSLTVVEAVPTAARFYEKQGFVVRDLLDCGDKMPEKWRGNTQKYAWMTRQPRQVNGS